MNFLEFRILDFLDILLVAFFMYQLYKLARGTVAINIFLGLISIYLVWQVVKALQMDMLSEILGQFIGLGVLAIVIVFQQEIRKFLLFIGSSNFRSRSSVFKQLRFFKEEQVLNTNVDSIVTACVSMAKTKTGVLIVIERTNKLDYLFNNSGDKMDAEVNKPLLESIFYKNSPLHDGAVIISKNRILATRVILPISTSQNIPSRLGLRHRAALGITENTDAVCLVVSEETGEISHIRDGNITIKKSPLELTQLMKEDISNI
ncbi:MAG: diadenylate cyclase CdaA [Flavobacteriales bacterium]|nr:diadenylate cyclase CdaA [Flavobacteriales bacterium]